MLYKYTNYIPNFNLTKNQQLLFIQMLWDYLKPLPEDGTKFIRIPKDLFYLTY